MTSEELIKYVVGKQSITILSFYPVEARNFKQRLYSLVPTIPVTILAEVPSGLDRITSAIFTISDDPYAANLRWQSEVTMFHLTLEQAQQETHAEAQLNGLDREALLLVEEVLLNMDAEEAYILNQKTKDILITRKKLREQVTSEEKPA